MKRQNTNSHTTFMVSFRGHSFGLDCLIFIFYIADNINSVIRIFAADSVVYPQVDLPVDHLILR